MTLIIFFYSLEPHTEKIPTFSFELKMFLKIERHFAFHFARIKLNWRYLYCISKQINFSPVTILVMVTHQSLLTISFQY